jgi:hypothetical protein
MPFNLGDPIIDDPGSITDYPATMGESAYAMGRRAYDSGGFVYGAYNALRGQVDWDYGKRVSKDDAGKRIGRLGLSLEVPDEGISQYKLDTLIWYKSREMRDQTDIQRGPGGVLPTAANFAAGLVGSLGDPVGLAANFIPVVQEAKWANALKAAGASAFARAAVRAKYGAAEGVVGAALVEPLMIAHNKYSQLDYSAMDSFLNVAMGGLTGGGLHMIGGYGYDKFTGVQPPRIRGLLEGMDERVKAKVLEEYVRAAEEGRPPKDAMKMFMEEFASGYDMWRSKKASASTDAELVSRAAERDIGAVRRAEGQINEFRFPQEDQYTGRHLFAALALDGGIKVRDANGDLTKEGAEVLALIKDTKYPGLINNVHGTPPDYIRERLAEDGWFGEGKGGDVQEFYDLLDAASRGDVRHPSYDEAKGLNKDYQRFLTGMERELREAGVQPYHSLTEAAGRLADHRAKLAYERAANDPDFDPEEFLYRDKSEPMDPDEEAARFGEDEGAEPYSFAEAAEAKRQASRDAATVEVDNYRATDEEEAIADDISRLDRIVQSLKSRDMWTKADDELLEAAKVDRELAAFYEQVYKAAAVCEQQ